VREDVTVAASVLIGYRNHWSRWRIVRHRLDPEPTALIVAASSARKLFEQEAANVATAIVADVDDQSVAIEFDQE
jgi:hypothetical protein